MKKKPTESKPLTLDQQIAYVQRHRDFLHSYTGLESIRCNHTFGLEESDARAYDDVLKTLKALRVARAPAPAAVAGLTA